MNNTHWSHVILRRPFVCLNQFFWSLALKFAKTALCHIGSTLALSLIVGLGFSLSACNKKPAEPAAKVAAPAVTAVTPPAPSPSPAPVPVPVPAASPAAPVSLMSELDWSAVPESTADIGAYPYFKAPDLLVVRGRGGSGVSKTGFTEEQDFGKLITYTGNSFYAAEGKVATLWFDMADNNKGFNQYLFDKSMDSYILGAGAKLLFKGSIPRALRDELNKTEPDATYKFMVAGTDGSDPIRFYAYKQKDKKLIIQVSSNSASSYVKFVELKDFKQSIQKYSAESMKKEIEATGKAVLNINFDADKATLKADGQTVVQQITALLKNNTGLKLSIEGHTDNTGSADHNKKLSIDRANTVMLALVADGINKSDLKSTGYGAEKPMVANDTKDNKAKNRRVELVKF